MGWDVLRIVFTSNVPCTEIYYDLSCWMADVHFIICNSLCRGLCLVKNWGKLPAVHGM